MVLLLDIGKTNKKCFVFDEDYRVVFEKTTQLPETVDEDGEPCEDLDLLKNWVRDSVREVLADQRFHIRAVNATAYGASFVHLDADGKALTPLYNYLKPFPENLKKRFFDTYGSAEKIALETASPVLGNLNSGLQLYWLKHQKPLIFNQIKWSLHLPQYIAYLLYAWAGPKSAHAYAVSEMTSIGCHTLLWNFQKNDYHDWVKAEEIVGKFPPLVRSVATSRGDLESPRDGTSIHHSSFIIHHSSFITPHFGIGLHDSSAALIPYLACFEEPFVLISTGTWCITLNPFNDEPLTPEELAQDCLCYLSYEGKPVKAARYFGGHEHEQAVKNIAAQFGTLEDFYKNISITTRSPLAAAYFDFMRQLVEKQVISTRLALGNSPVRRIFVDGGFSKNEVYMTLLARSFPEMDVYAAEVAQATAIGAAIAVHPFWNEKRIPDNLIALKQIRV
ncbi:MAG: carbohydrate kinase [Lewinellaceae bacterium]|nr:carbohydrate kinase [Lewinellaceae bacterium]